MNTYICQFCGEKIQAKAKPSGNYVGYGDNRDHWHTWREYIPKRDDIRSSYANPILSETRRKNLVRAFPDIIWDFEEATVENIGWGDRPAFDIPGTFFGENRYVYVWYKQGNPSGGNPSLTVFDPQTGEVLLRISKAPLRDSVLWTREIRRVCNKG